MKHYSIFLIVLITLTAGTALAERMTIIATVANIRSGSGSWYQFRDFEEDAGWVHKSLVGKVKAVITKKDLCNIRSRPGTKEKIIFTVEKGIPFKVLKRKNRWLNVEHADGDKGWIHDSLVW
jgi:SH3-like domain-containing protein